MRYNLYHYLLLVLLAASVCACGIREPAPAQYAYERVMVGDSIQWMQLDYDDSHWPYWIEDEFRGVFWSRLSVKLPSTMVEGRPQQGLIIVATAAYEAYWDGVYLGTNGRLHSAKFSEVPGSYQWRIPLPDTLTQPGEHLLALRCTKADTVMRQHAYFSTGDYDILLREPLKVSLYMFVVAGAFLLASLYFFLLYSSDPKAYSVLIFAVICLTYLVLLLMEYLKLYYDYPYPFQRTRLQIIGYLHVVLALLIPMFFLIHFSLPYKRWIMLGIMITAVVLQVVFYESFDMAARQHTAFTGFYAMLIVAYAVYHRQKGALVVLGSLLAGTLLLNTYSLIKLPYVSGYDINLFLAFVLLLVAMVYVMIRKRRADRLAYQASLLRSERLKNELLKKNIRPHFIMNTLTSLIDWVEESPKEGVAFIHALANEFELLNEMADYTLIPIRQEIELCKNHLRVMGYRKEISYHWADDGIDANALIPPAIIHTAVENGVTHSIPDSKGNIGFLLTYELTDEYQEYRLDTLAGRRQNDQLDRSDAGTGGTGLKYIRSRLQESYGQDWELRSLPTAQGWVTIIRIFTLPNTNL